MEILGANCENMSPHMPAEEVITSSSYNSANHAGRVGGKLSRGGGLAGRADRRFLATTRLVHNLPLAVPGRLGCGHSIAPGYFSLPLQFLHSINNKGQKERKTMGKKGQCGEEVESLNKKQTVSCPEDKKRQTVICCREQRQIGDEL